jgi:hypothetical protein
MPGIRLTSQAAREGCLRYIYALGVLTNEQLMALRQQLLITSARRVADTFWTQFWATQPPDEPDPLQEEIACTLERLAVEPDFFRRLAA